MLKFNANKVFFTADTHFNHTNILKYCGRSFESVAAMNEAIMAELRTVPTDATLIHLGDISLNKRIGASYMAQLQCKKILIMGNHDCGTAEFYKKEGGFDLVSYSENIEIDGVEMLLAHYPYQDDQSTIKQKFKVREEGLFLLHGHVHGSHAISHGFDVGLDNNEMCVVPGTDAVKYAKYFYALKFVV